MPLEGSRFGASPKPAARFIAARARLEIVLNRRLPRIVQRVVAAGVPGDDGVITVPNVSKNWAGIRRGKCGKIVTYPWNMSHINTIEGIGPSHAKKFAEVGVTTVEHLLKAGATPKGRKELCTKTGFHEHHLLKWVNQADLFRIKGVGRQYAELLQASGVDSVKELAQRKPDHLHETLKTSNETKRQVHIVPNLTSITNWVGEAKKLPRVVSY